MAKDDIVVINQPGLEQRTSKSGRVRYVVRVKSEPVAFNLNAKELGAPVAEALAHYFREKVKGIAATAAPATIKARERFAKAASEGKAWALKRYSGGKMGASTPNTSSALFNDSGRLAQSIQAMASGESGWRINVAGNRLDPRTANNGGAAAVERIWSRLVQLVPAFADVSIAFASDELLKARVKMQERMVKKQPMTDKNVTGWDVAKKFVETVRTGARAFGLTG
jgi:hypothetical protein